MDYAKFINGIRFNTVQPMQDLTVKFKINSLERLLRAQALLANVDAYQSQLPEDDATYRERLAPILGIPRMSTFPIAAIIQRTMTELPDESAYVNVGVWNGYTLFAGMLGNADKRVVGIDNFSQFGGPKDAFLNRFQELKSERHSFYDMDYREYFETRHEGEIGFYYYDGEHSYANQLEGLKVAEPHFSQNCTILVDDTNWPEPRQATMDFISQSSSDFEILLDERTAWNGHPTFWNGLMVIVRRGGD